MFLWYDVSAAIPRPKVSRLFRAFALNAISTLMELFEAVFFPLASWECRVLWLPQHFCDSIFHLIFWRETLCSLSKSSGQLAISYFLSEELQSQEPVHPYSLAPRFFDFFSLCCFKLIALLPKIETLQFEDVRLWISSLFEAHVHPSPSNLGWILRYSLGVQFGGCNHFFTT